MTATPRPPAADSRADNPRKDVWTNEQMALFLTTLAKTGMVSAACDEVEKSEASAFWLRRSSRGRVFAFGWKATHLLAREVLEDRLLNGLKTETITTRIGNVTHTRRFDRKLSMWMLNRLEQRAVDLRDVEMAVLRSVAGSFEAFIELIASGGDDAAFAQFLIDHPDPLAAQVAAARQREAGAAPTGDAARRRR